MKMEIKRINKQETILVRNLLNEYHIFYKQNSDVTIAQNFLL